MRKQTQLSVLCSGSSAAERLTLNQDALGSIPSRSTARKEHDEK